MKIILKAVPLVVAGVAVVMFVRGARLRAASQVNVSTYHNDNARTGQNLNETILTTGNVNVSTFGRLFTVAADGYVYAQPLIVSNLNILGVLRDVVFVETEHDGAYAFDADSGQQLWYTSFINPSKGISTVSNNDIGCGDIVPEVGITSTPAIDTETNSIYMVAKTKENGAFFQRLHVLDITTGEEKPHSPVTIEATVPGKGDGSVGGNVRFDPLREHQRPSLLLQHGLVEIAWASHCDISPYHGWVMAFSANTYQKTAVWNSTPNGGFGGIWQGDAGLAGDSNFYIYGVTGNGTFDANTSGGRDYGNSVVKLEMSESANVGRLDDYFTPFNQSYLSENDLDLGAGGLTILPDHPGGPYAHLLVQSGKDGSIYLVNRDNMGKYNPSNNDQIVQFIPYVTGGIWGAPPGGITASISVGPSMRSSNSHSILPRACSRRLRFRNRPAPMAIRVRSPRFQQMEIPMPLCGLLTPATLAIRGPRFCTLLMPPILGPSCTIRRKIRGATIRVLP